MRWVLIFVFCLAGCDSPGFGYTATEVTRVEVAGNMFSLRRSGDLVQAIRTNFVRRPDMNLIGQGAELAIERTYGCRVANMRGDVALMVAELDCKRIPREGDWAPWVKPRRSKISCLGDVFLSTSERHKEFEVVCF